jgi:mRNA-degrading endonuclease YafQ of YafQ-DinJ toxin-antitoxin module
MPKIHLDPLFEKAYQKFTKRNKIRKKKIAKSITLFAKNPSHPSLKTEKLAGTKIWTIRIDRGNRMFFIWSKNRSTAIFFNIGPHDTYRTFINQWQGMN